MTIIQITTEQWAVFTAHFTAVEASLANLEGYLGNMLVFLIWATLALCFIMAVAFYIVFTGRGRK